MEVDDVVKVAAVATAAAAELAGAVMHAVVLEVDDEVAEAAATVPAELAGAFLHAAVLEEELAAAAFEFWDCVCFAFLPRFFTTSSSACCRASFSLYMAALQGPNLTPRSSSGRVRLVWVPAF
jgi:hypothetical protein